MYFFKLLHGVVRMKMSKSCQRRLCSLSSVKGKKKYFEITNTKQNGVGHITGISSDTEGIQNDDK